jgi:rubrerythrin
MANKDIKPEYERILNESPIDEKSLAKAIHDSRKEPVRDLVFLEVLTSYTCKICGNLFMNGDSNIPLICPDCADDLAKSIIIDGYPALRLLKK